MSLDFQIAHACPHLVLEETVPLQEDRRSLIARAPIGSSSLIRVIANDEYYIPPSGLKSPATLIGEASGPFRITGCLSSTGVVLTEDNHLTVTGSSEEVSFRLPLGNRLTTDALVTFFQRGLSTITVVNDRGHLVFIDGSKVGPESRITLTGRARDALGFEKQYASRGKVVYPGWSLNKREDIMPTGVRGQASTARYVEFSSPIRGNPTFKVSYVSTPERCPRCNGTFVENDWRFDLEGDVVEVVNEDLLYQACMKMLLTLRGSNPFHPSYGCTIMGRIGSKVLGATATLLQEDVRSALQRVQNLQRQQAKVQAVSLKERLYSILSANVLPHKSDPTTFLVDVVVSNGTGEPVQLNIVFSVPGAVALAGTNGLSLGV